MALITSMTEIRSQRNIKKEKKKRTRTKLFYISCNGVICVYSTIPTMAPSTFKLSDLKSVESPKCFISTSNFFFFLKKNQREIIFLLFRVFTLYLSFCTRICFCHNYAYLISSLISVLSSNFHAP